MFRIPDSHPESTGKILSENSPKDLSWETHHATMDIAAKVFLSSENPKQIRRGERMSACAPYLIFKLLQNPDSEELKHKLRYAQFCHVRLCSLCMSRRSMAWRARYHQAWPFIDSEYPNARYFHLVLTVPNCPVTELKKTIQKMNQAWNRMVARNTWPALGFIRSVEVTKDSSGGAHPHIHALMMVPPSYFTYNYMSRDTWRFCWAKALKVPEASIIHPFIRAVKGGKEEVAKSVLEVVKYAVKTKTMEPMLKTKEGQKWFLELDNQLCGTRAVNLGGTFKQLMKDDDITDEEMILQDKTEMGNFIHDVRYDWFASEKHYIQTKILSEIETLFWDRQERNMKENLEKRKAAQKILQQYCSIA